MFIEAMLYHARTRIPWRDLPEDFVKWDAVYNRFRRWEARGAWRKLWQRLKEQDCQAATHLFIDATIMRAHPHAAGAQKNGGQEAQALGRSRGSFSTKLHAGCISETTGVCLILSSGARHDAPTFDQVWDDKPELPALAYAALEKGYDSDHIRARIEKEGIEAVIPPKSNRKVPIAYNAGQYK